jgi:hypothetical protein
LKAFAAAYLDDIVVSSRFWEEHIAHLEQIFATLRKHQIATSPNKTRLAQTSTHYLDSIISRHGNEIKKDPRITAAICDFQHPNDPNSYLFLKRLRVYIPLWVCVIFIAD